MAQRMSNGNRREPTFGAAPRSDTSERTEPRFAQRPSEGEGRSRPEPAKAPAPTARPAPAERPAARDAASRTAAPGPRPASERPAARTNGSPEDRGPRPERPAARREPEMRATDPRFDRGGEPAGGLDDDFAEGAGAAARTSTRSSGGKGKAPRGDTRPSARGGSPAKPAKSSRSRGSGGRGGGWGWRIVRWTFAACVWGVIAVAGVLVYTAMTLPPTSEWAVPPRPPNVRIVDETGQVLANRGDTGGEQLSLDEMPKYLPEAVMAIEDRRFRDHFGIDPIGLLRAMVTNLRAGSTVQGGSTLTQQLAKNLFLEPDRTLQRKLQEVVMSLWLETEYDKDQILDMYLNRVYLGAGAYGVDAAARRYFGKSARDVTVAEAAMIAGLLKAPSRYAPTRDLDAARDRAALVLAAMADEGYITAAEEKQALAEPASVSRRALAASAGYVADWVMDLVPGHIGAVSEDIVVETTIDSTVQKIAEAKLEQELADKGGKYGVRQGAVVVLDGAGAVKALVGGRNYEQSQFNRAVVARRQPGSSFKPFVYLAALERGLTPDTVRVDQPIQVGKWTPSNYTKKYYGPVSLTRALANSLNTVAVELGQEVGPAAVVATAHRLGITSDLAANPSIALGTSEVTLLELTSAYVPFSNGGFAVMPHVVRRITTEDGKVLYDRQGSGSRQVVSDEKLGEMNAMLSEALNSGTAQRARIPGWPAGGKTGTSQDFRDAWFVGYTAYFTAGVWLGNDDGTPTKKATGGTMPAELWGAMMKEVHAGMQVADLPGAKPSRADPIGELIPVDGPSADAPPQAPMSDRDVGIAPPVAQGGGVGEFLKNLFGG